MLQRYACSVLILCGSLALIPPAADAMGNKDKVVQSKTAQGTAPAPSAQSLQSMAKSLAAQPGLAATRGKFAAVPSPARAWLQQASRPQTMIRGGKAIHMEPGRGVIAVEPAPGSLKSLAQPKSGESAKALALRFVEENPSVFGLADPSAQLSLKRTDTDQLGMEHLFFEQRIGDTPFWGRELTAHFDRKSGELLSIHCLLAATIKKSSPGFALVTAAEATRTAQDALAANGIWSDLTGRQAAILNYSGPTAALYYWQAHPGADTHLAWVVELRPNIKDWFRFFIDAETGAVLETYNATAADGPATANATNLLGQTKNLKTYQVGSTFYLIDTTRPMFQAGQTSQQLIDDPKGVLNTLDLRNTNLTSQAQIFHVTSGNNTWTDATSVSAHDYGSVAFEYFRATHNRNSLNGQGGTVFSLIHVTDNGQSMENAFWNGAAMIYGDGGTQFKPLARGLDVAVHEMSHGVIQHSADLEYKNQSGALNESYADVFGVIVDADDFLLGEDVVQPASFPSGALRNIQDPHNGGTSLSSPGWQPSHMNEFVNLPLSQDNGGVHVNSGITNRAAYLVMNALDRTQAGQIYYRALTMYLVKQSNFTDARLALERAADDLFGASSSQKTAVSNAFTAVGIGGGGGTTPPDTGPVTNGSQFIVCAAGDTGLLFRTETTPQTFTQMTTHGVNLFTDRPAAVDPFGQTIFFVDSGFALRSVPAAGSGDSLVNNETQWFSVAISPTGRRIAFTRNFVENLVFVFDLQSQTAVAIPLFHPTSAQGVYQDIVQFADTMAWLDDDLLIYDCLNEYDSPGGTVSFWDINVVDVSTETIYPILAPQPSNVNVGIPTVSTRNPAIICFDYLDSSSGATFILGMNIYTGQIATMLDAAGLIPIPDYSVDDNNLVFGVRFGDNTTAIYQGPLSANRLQMTANPTLIINGATMPLWFAQGTPLPARDSLVNYILKKSASPGVVDTNGDNRVDAADVEKLND